MTTATLDVTTQTNMAKLTQQSAAFRALNQLCSVTAGRKWARDTDSLKDDPAARIQKCMELTLMEAATAASLQRDDPDADRQLSQANRKIDSLQSLALLARIIQTEVIWDDD